MAPSDNATLRNNARRYRIVTVMKRAPPRAHPPNTAPSKLSRVANSVTGRRRNFVT